MTKKQDYLYWREWAAARRVQPDADRHELHVRALGGDKSHKDFTNAEFDAVLGVFRSISQPGNMGAQLRQMRQTRTRLLWKIQVEQTALLAVYTGSASAYIQSICTDKFHTADVTMLDGKQLEQLRMTLARAIDRKRKEKGHTIRQMRELAHLAVRPQEADEDGGLRMEDGQADEGVPAGAEHSDNEPF